MKRFWLPLLFPLLLLSKDDTYFGLGPYFQTQPYKEADPVVLATPVIFFDNSLFYVRWVRVGMYFYGDKSDDLAWGLSFTAQPQSLGYDETPAMTQINRRSPTPILQGMEERESSWEAGIAFSAESHGFFTEFLAMQDILNRSNALKLRAEAGMSVKHGRWQFVPSLMLIWLSQPFTNYYYGVPDDEADLSLGRTAYRTDAALNVAVQSYIKYTFADHWHLLANLRVDRFDDTIQRSPIVGDSYMASGMLSVLYSFNLFGEERAAINPPERR